MIDLIPNKTLLFCVHSSVSMATSKPGRRKYKKKTTRRSAQKNSTMVLHSHAVSDALVRALCLFNEFACE